MAATKRSTVTAPPKLTVVKLMPFPEKGGGPALNAEPLSWHPRAEAKHVRNILGLDGRVMPGARAVAMSVPVGGSGGAGTFADTLSFISNGACSRKIMVLVTVHGKHWGWVGTGLCFWGGFTCMDEDASGFKYMIRGKISMMFHEHGNYLDFSGAEHCWSPGGLNSSRLFLLGGDPWG